MATKRGECIKDLHVREQQTDQMTRADTDTSTSRPHIPALSVDEKSTLKFTDIMNNLQHVYPKQQMSDISTSFGFICLLHLANEKGLVIENVDDWTDLTVRKDLNALVLEGGD